MYLLKKLIVLVGIFFLSSCALMMEERSFLDEMDYETEGFFIPGEDFQVTPGDHGQAFRNDTDIRNRTPASAFTKEERIQVTSLQRELSRREQSLSEREYREYLRHQDYLSTVSEKIYYLKLPRSRRREYLSGKSLNFSYDTQPTYNRPSYLPSYHERTMRTMQGVYQGMEKQEVMNNWGRPERIDVAGDPRFENERWLYRRGGSSQVVYFENGRVNGWTLE